MTTVSLERLADTLYPKPEPRVSTAYGTVEGVNADGSFQVRLNASSTTTRCARLCDAQAGDRVLVLIQSNGHCAAIGRVGGNKAPVVLYDNPSGNAGDVTLAESVANYDYARVYYWVGAEYASADVYKPNGKEVSLFAVRTASLHSNMHFGGATYRFDGASLKCLTQGIADTSGAWSGSASTCIYRVEAWCDGAAVGFGTRIDGGSGGGDVDGVKGDAEAAYRTGLVNLTPANLGAAEASHAHAIADVTGLHNALDGKADDADVTALQAALDGKVSKAGDTMTGNLAIRSRQITRGAAIASGQGIYPGGIDILDAEGASTSLFYMQPVQYNYGTQTEGCQIGTARTVNGTDIFHSIEMAIDANGNAKVNLGYPAAWRTAMGAAASSHNHAATSITSGILPQARGGTGASSVADAMQSAIYTICEDYGAMYLDEDADEWHVGGRLPEAYGGVPPGGTAGQVLTKTGTAQDALAWRTPSGGSGGSAVGVGVYSATCATAAATAAKDAATTTGDFTLEVGAIVSVVFSATNSAAVGSLTLNVDSTGAKPIKYVYNGSYSNIPGAGYIKANQIYTFAYDGTNWIVQMMYNTNTDTMASNVWFYNTILAKSAIAANSIVVGDADGYAQAASGVTFDITYPIQWSSVAMAANGTNYTGQYVRVYDKSLAYISGFSGTRRSAVYLVCTLDGTTATVASEVCTCTVPTTEDGKVYIPIGRLGNQSSGTNFFCFAGGIPRLYAYQNGSFGLYDPSAPVLLWENADPTAPFAGQTLSVDWSGYSELHVSLYVPASSNIPAHYQTSVVNTSNAVSAVTAQREVPLMRVVTLGSGTIAFGDGIFHTGYNADSVRQANGLIVPASIKGVR